MKIKCRHWSWLNWSIQYINRKVIFSVIHLNFNYVKIYLARKIRSHLISDKYIDSHFCACFNSFLSKAVTQFIYVYEELICEDKDDHSIFIHVFLENMKWLFNKLPNHVFPELKSLKQLIIDLKITTYVWISGCSIIRSTLEKKYRW